MTQEIEIIIDDTIVLTIGAQQALPDSIVLDENYVHTDNNYTDADKNKVANALTSETDPTVPSWAKQPSKPSYNKSEIGLGNVDNTSDANKPVSNATQTALNNKANSSQILTDVPAGALFTDTTYSNATTSVSGLMSSVDKTKLNGIAANANNYSHPNHTGDVASVGDGVTTISNNVVSNAKLSTMPSNTIKGNNTGSAANPIDLTNTQVKALLSLSKSDVGLSNVDNTSDLSKPISTATQSALNAKQDTLFSGTNIKTINNNSILGGGNLNIPSGINLTDLSATSPIQYDNVTGVISIPAASTSTNGYLSSTDWNTFNNKQSALGFTPENIANKKTTLADNSDTYYPTQKAVKTAVDAKLNSSALSISTGQVAFGSGSNTIGGDNGLFWDNSNKRLGIGTTNPTSKLDVSSGSYDGLTLTRNAQSAGVCLASRSYDTSNTLRNSNRIIFGAIATSGAADGYIAFSPYVSNVETERMRITSTGKIGIGTNDPKGVLDVVSTTNGSLPFPRMTASQRTAISSPSVGTHVYQTDGTEGVYVYKSGGWAFAY